MSKERGKDNRAARKRHKEQFFSDPVIANQGEAIAYDRALRSLCKGMVVDSGKAMIRLYRQYTQKIAEGAEAAAVAAAIGDAVALELAAMWDTYTEQFTADGGQLAAAMVNRQTALALRSARDAAGEAMAAAGGGGGVPPTIGALSASTGAESGNFGGLGMMALPGDAIPVEVAPIVKAAITENVNLIKSIPPQYLDRVAGAVTRSMQSGGSIKMLIEEIRHYGKMTMRRARNIAHDQVHKAFEAINVAEFKRLGITKFRWLHTGGSTHPREYHLHDAPAGLNGGVFSLDNPPVIDLRTGERGFPGQLPYCRCTMCAVVEW